MIKINYVLTNCQTGEQLLTNVTVTDQTTVKDTLDRIINDIKDLELKNNALYTYTILNFIYFNLDDLSDSNSIKIKKPKLSIVN